MTSLRAARSTKESCIQCEKFFPSMLTCKRLGMLRDMDGFDGCNRTTCDHFKGKEADE